MMVQNVHTRLLRAEPAAVGALIDSLASPADALWPRTRWPAMSFDSDGLHVGAYGGHGPIRYSVARHVPGREAVFRFAPGLGLVGEHRFEVRAADGGTVLRHVAEGHLAGRMVVGWPLIVRWLHDALIEDSLDRAQAAVEGREWRPRRLGPWVRLCRRLLARNSGP